jgi:putative flippase GtrA
MDNLYIRVLIQSTFDITDARVCSWILGICVDYTTESSITFHQKKCIHDMLTQFIMLDFNPSLLPWSNGAKLTFHEGSTDLV